MALRAGFHGTVGQPSAQVIDGSLKFDSGKTQYLKRTFPSAGNQKTFTFSVWLKRASGFGAYRAILTTLSSDGTSNTGAWIGSGNEYYYFFGNSNFYNSAVARDTGWYHVVYRLDTTIASPDSDRLRVYVNGNLMPWNTSTSQAYPTLNEVDLLNSAASHSIGRRDSSNEHHFDGSMSQFYFIDGQSLGPENFGYTDPLTNTWRPKKYTGSFALGAASSFSLADNDFTWSGLRSASNDPDSGVLTDGNLNYTDTFWGNNGANGSYLDIDMTGASAGETFLIRYWNAAEAGGQTITATCKQVDSGGSDISGTAVSQTWNQGQKWNDGSGYITQTIQSNTSKIRLIFSGNNNNSYGWGIGEVEMEQVLANQNSFYLPMDGNSPIGQDKSGRGNDWTPVNFGGSNSVDKATGALPILEGAGGAVANVGVRTDANASSLVLALPLVGSKDDVSNQINSGSTTKVVTANGNASASTTQSNFYGGSFYFDGTGDYLSVAENSDFQLASSAVDFTIEAYVYGSAFSGAFTSVVGVWGGSSGNDQWLLSVSTSGVLGFAWSPYSNGSNFLSGGTLSTNQWHHVAVTRSGNTFRLFLNGIVVASGTDSATSTDNTQLEIGRYGAGGTPSSEWQGYIQEVRIYKGVAKYTSNFIPASSNPDILPDTPSGVSGGSKLTKPTEGAVTFDGSGDYLSVADNGDFTLSGDYTVECFFNMSATNGNHAIFGLGPFAGGNNTKLLFRYESSGNFNYYIGGDILRSRPISKNSWYHLAVVRNSNVVKIFLNGTQVGADISHSATISGDVHVGSGNNGGSEYNTITGFISNFRLIKDQALYTADFTPPSAPLTTTSQSATASNVKLLCCQSNNSATVYEVSPGNITANGDAAASNFNPFTTDINAVRGQETGYCTWNPLVGTGTLSDGNLKFDGASNWKNTDGTISFSSGKWYYEGTYIGSQYGSAQGNIAAGIGFKKTTASLLEGANAEPVNSADYRNNTIAFYQNGYFTDFGTGTGTHTSIRSQIAAGDVVGVSIDLDNGSYEFYLNGISITSGTVSYTGELVPWAEAYYVNAFVCNFGQKPFKFPPPEGFQPLNAANVRPSTVIARPDQYVGVTTYTSTTDGQTITGYNFKPDFVYSKARSGTYMWGVHDSVRGATKVLTTNGTGGENDDAVGLLSFIDGGYVTGTDGSYGSVNYQSGNTYVAYGWKAGGNKGVFNVDDVGYASAAAAGLDGGTITPIGASVGTKQGFSILKWNGTSGNGTLSHGLTEAPNFVIVKANYSPANWPCYHSGLTDATKYIWLNSTNGENTQTAAWNSTAPTSNLFHVGGEAEVNRNGFTSIAYLWHDVPGLQKFGSYTGNGSQNFVELGFKPALVIVKRAVVNSSPDQTNDYASWTVMDFKRLSYNGLTPNHLFANKNSNEGKRGNGALTTGLTDMTLEPMSNGFYLNGPGTEVNANTGTYIYCAWAEAPTFNLYGGQSNAR